MDGAEVLTLVSPDTSLINDNYCVSPPVVNQVKVWQDSNMQKQNVQLVVQDSLRCCKVVKVASSNKFQRHSKQTVSCLVANHVPAVTLEGHPQKKGIRPDVKKTEIKPVKDVSFVN